MTRRGVVPVPAAFIAAVSDVKVSALLCLRILLGVGGWRGKTLLQFLLMCPYVVEIASLQKSPSVICHRFCRVAFLGAKKITLLLCLEIGLKKTLMKDLFVTVGFEVWP